MKELHKIVKIHGKKRAAEMLGIKQRWLHYLLKGERTPGKSLEKLIKILAV